MTNIGAKLINFIFPKSCILCGEKGEYLCNSCKKTLTTHPEICPYCHKTSANYQTCLDCKISPYNALEGVIIPFSYTDTTKKLITKFKYKHQKDIGDFFADRLILALQTNQKLNNIINRSIIEELASAKVANNGVIASDNGVIASGSEAIHLKPNNHHGSNQKLNTKNSTLISYIPTHRYRKHFVKGYNQSEILAQIISQKIQIPIIDLLQKPQATKAQAKLQRKQRLVNLQGKFALNSDIKLNNNETIILVDDISTTNSTLNEAARTIKSQYPHTKIRGLVIARHN